jgi:hypothetical protein
VFEEYRQQPAQSNMKGQAKETKSLSDKKSLPKEEGN